MNKLLVVVLCTVVSTNSFAKSTLKHTSGHVKSTSISTSKDIDNEYMYCAGYASAYYDVFKKAPSKQLMAQTAIDFFSNQIFTKNKVISDKKQVQMNKAFSTGSTDYKKGTNYRDMLPEKCLYLITQNQKACK